MTFDLSYCSPRTYNLYWCHRAVWFSWHWPAPCPAACRPSPCPARPAGMKAAPGGRSLWVTLWRKRWASPPPCCQENYSCRDSCLVRTAANFLCSFKPNCCQLEEPSTVTVCLWVCQTALPCSVHLHGLTHAWYHLQTLDWQNETLFPHYIIIKTKKYYFLTVLSLQCFNGESFPF